jgi:glycosyltransferase involved in cell wall biosynthesis
MSERRQRRRVVFAYRYGLLGGVSAQLLNRYPWFSSEFDVHILYEHDHGMTRRFPPGVAEVAAEPEAMEAALRRHDPDVLFVIDSPAFIEAWTRTGRPGKLVVEVHTTTANRGYLAELDDSHGIAAFVTVSDYMRERLTVAGMFRLAPIFVVPNCLDSRWFQRPESSQLERQCLMWVGKIDSHKRWRAATDVIDEVLAGSVDGVDSLFVGGYTAPAGSISDFLRRLHSSPFLRRSTWWPYVAYERMPAIYGAVGSSGGGLLMTTRDESFGMAAAEAVLMGCPVIAPRVGALPEILPEESLYDPGDWQEVSEKGRRLLADPVWRETLATATRSKVMEIVHPKNALASFRNVVDSVV